MKGTGVFNPLKCAVVFLLLSFIILNCSNSKEKIRGEESKQPKKDIIGKWESLDKTLTLEFKADGKLISQLKKGGLNVDSKSETVFLDEKHLLGVWEHDLPTFEVHVYPEQMVLKRDNGDKIQFNRIQN